MVKKYDYVLSSLNLQDAGIILTLYVPNELYGKIHQHVTTTEPLLKGGN
jgi:hypothetical protein